MDKVIQATGANCHFSRILSEVEQGDSFTVTSHGRPIARLVPVAATDATDKAERLNRFLDYLRQQPVMEAGRWTRAELYDD